MELQNWMAACIKRADACVRVAVEGGAAYDSCHRTLCIIKDTWDDMQCTRFPRVSAPRASVPSVVPAAGIPFRGSGSEDVANGDYDQITIGNAMFSACSPTELVDNVLPLVLAAAAADARVTDAALRRMIKDAFDHGVTAPQDPVPQEEAGEEMDESDVPADVKAGRARLAALVDDIVEWDFLFSWKPKHKMRRGIDRRFDGPKHLRTRDYDSDG